MSDCLPARERLAFALDVPTIDQAREWIDRLSGSVGVFKVGLELFIRFGPDAVQLVKQSGARCFLDLKLHDIPETVARAVRSAGQLGVDYLTVHASGGASMVAQAIDAARASTHPPKILAVTVLTSFDAEALREIGVTAQLEATVRSLGSLAMTNGADGLVCSAHEVAALRSAHPAALIVVPGIRPAGTARGDQSRVATPAEAIRAGADLLVMGRPLRDAPDPIAAADAVLDQISEALAS